LQQLLLIYLTADAVYFSKRKPLLWANVDLQIVSTNFKPNTFWTIKPKYIAAEKRVHAEVISYANELDIATFWDTTEGYDLPEISKLSFASIHTKKLLDCLVFENDTKLKNNSVSQDLESLYDEEIVEISEEDFAKMKAELVEKPKIEKEIFAIDNEIKPVEKKKVFEKIIDENFTIVIKDLQFNFGYVETVIKSKQLNAEYKIQIYNEHIREEFDAVKNYFSNVLKLKKIKVNVKFTIAHYKVINIVATSFDIQKINKQIIESVKFEFVKSSFKQKMPTIIDKSLFTMDDLFDAMTETKAKSKAFYNDPMDMLDDMLHISNTKHYKHLRFLSSNHKSDILKLRFVLKPFSFLFLIEGDRHYHIIWETLNTAEATYIWQCEKNIHGLKAKLQKIDDIINTIAVQGKLVYLNSQEMECIRIFHDYSDVIDGFVKWKNDVEAVLS
jgi:hypothetical protein